MVGSRFELEGLVPKQSVQRTVLWRGGPEFRVAVVARRASKRHYVRDGDNVGGPYVRIMDPYVDASCGIASYMHGRTTVSALKRLTKRKLPVPCTVEIAWNVYNDNTNMITVDYHIDLHAESWNGHIEVRQGTPKMNHGESADCEVIPLPKTDAILLLKRIQ